MKTIITVHHFEKPVPLKYDDLAFESCKQLKTFNPLRRWPSGRVLAYRAQGHRFNPWPNHYLKTENVGTRCLPAKHSSLKGRFKGKRCKNQGLEWRPPLLKGSS